MTPSLRTLCAAVAVFSLPLFSSAGVIKSAGTASTSNTTTTTTTSGQRNILMNVDPFNVASFQLDVSFEADKAMFVGVQGLNGYIVDDFHLTINGNMGIIDNIHGFYPGFNDRLTDGDLEGPITNGVPNPPAPPAGEIDIFQLRFIDLRPDLDKLFGVFAGGPDDYMTGFDPATGGFTNAVGPFNGQTGVQSAFSTVPGIPNGGTPLPLPPAIWIGLLGGAGALANAMRFRKAA
jgi:hypothetical protein